jgi:hypothetical protein
MSIVKTASGFEVSRESVGGKQTVLLETKYRYNHKGQLSHQEDPGNAGKIIRMIYMETVSPFN